MSKNDTETILINNTNNVNDKESQDKNQENEHVFDRENILNFLSDEQRKLIKSDEFISKICIHCEHWTVKYCLGTPDRLYVFSDNDIKTGLGGQAIIRECKNSIGIPTKKLPAYHGLAFYNDKDFKSSCEKIQKAIVEIIIKSAKYKEIVFPVGGFGTERAKLKEKAPKTFKYLNTVIDECFGIDYEDILKNGLRAEINI